MATTTATVSINSTDLLSSPLSLSASTVCMKAGTTIGLELVEAGRGEIKEADASKTAKFGLATALGRLYAGDWMFIPWSQTDVAAEIVIEAEPAGAVCPYEYAVFKEAETLVDHS